MGSSGRGAAFEQVLGDSKQNKTKQIVLESESPGKLGRSVLRPYT
jgi:hypothetical protein